MCLCWKGCWEGRWVWMGVGCPCPPVRNDIVTRVTCCFVVRFVWLRSWSRPYLFSTAGISRQESCSWICAHSLSFFPEFFTHFDLLPLSHWKKGRKKLNRKERKLNASGQNFLSPSNSSERGNLLSNESSCIFRPNQAIASPKSINLVLFALMRLAAKKIYSFNLQKKTSKRN